jgi:uncharacterized membrane protein YbhN (UPF0104 family)
VSAVCLWALATRLDWPGVAAALAAAHWPLVALAAALTLANLLVRALRWRLLLGASAPPFGTLLATYTVGVAAGLLLPASGELARAMLLARRGGLRTSYVLGSVAVEKLLDTAAVVALFALGLWRAAGPGWLGSTIGLASAALLLAALALVLVVVRAPRGGSAAPGWLAGPAGRLGVAVGETWMRFAAGVAAVARLPWPQQVGIVALTLVSWADACLVTVCALAAFALPADWALAAVLYGALLLGLSVPSAPGAIGTFELVTVAVLQAFGLPSAASGAFALGFHAVAFAPPLLAAALVWLLPTTAARPQP